MWKRIRSNRDPRDTLFIELGKEFKPYVNSFEQLIKAFVSRKPKWVLWSMVILLTASAILSFTVFREHDQQRNKPNERSKQVSSGFNEILLTTQKLRNTSALKQVIDSLSAKKNLTMADSAKLNSALDSLATLQKSLNLQQHEH
jgi:hypothetical protein